MFKKMKRPPYNKFPEVISDKIILREVSTEDIKDLIDISFYDGKPALTVEDAAEMQNKINIDYQNGSSIHWCIVDKHTHKIVGTLGYYRGFENGVGELGCVLKSKFRGQGYMTIAMKLAIEFGFNEIGLTKITAITSKQNYDALKLLERLNFMKAADLPDDEIEYNFVKN